MTTRNYVWRTEPTSTEGTICAYVDSYTGSDLYGNGTRQKPYKTIAFARSKGIRSFVIRGKFLNENATGALEIYGDFPGAAEIVSDSIGQLRQSGFHNVILKSNENTGITQDFPYGHTGDHNILINCGLGDSKLYVTTDLYNSPNHVTYTVYARLTSSFSIYVGEGGHSKKILQNTFFSLKISKIQKDTFLNKVPIERTIFSDFDRPANEEITYSQCLFDADCKWYYMTGDSYDSSTDIEIEITGETSADRQQSLIDGLEAVYDEKGVAESSRVYPIFTDCIFSRQTADEIFNNPDHDDYTLISGCDADLGMDGYIGALPPCRNIPIIDNSEGIKETWDERSASGCIVVDGGKICIDDNIDGDGEILSKVFTINPITTQFNAVYANFSSQFSDYHAYANMNNFLSGIEILPKNDPDEEDTEFNTLIAGNSYLMSAKCNYNGNTINGGEVLVCKEADVKKFFTADPSNNCKAQEILEPNVMEVLYCRCRNAVYARVGISDNLQAGATYLNDSGMNITYHNRTIANGESFVCMIDGEHFSCEDSTKEIAILFDDTRVPAVEWIPASTFGQYFVAKSAGAIIKDAYGVPKSSGNLRAYPTTGLKLSTMDRKYIQFAVKVKRYVAHVS